MWLCFCIFILFSVEIKMSMVTYLRQLFPFPGRCQETLQGKRGSIWDKGGGWIIFCLERNRRKESGRRKSVGKNKVNRYAWHAYRGGHGQSGRCQPWYLGLWKQRACVAVVPTSKHMDCQTASSLGQDWLLFLWCFFHVAFSAGITSREYSTWGHSGLEFDT